MGHARHYLRDHRPLPPDVAEQLQHQVEATAAVSAEERAELLALHEAERREHDDLDERAARLWPEDWPHSQHNRKAWKAGVMLARRSTKGWVCDVEVIHG